jgi:iron(III) transport system substrate-binding protein
VFPCWRQAAAVVALSPLLAACGSDADLTIYSGRNEQLVGELVAQLEERIGGTVEVRYGGSAELAAQLLEEGDATDADVFFSQDAGALGALDAAGRLDPAPRARARRRPRAVPRRRRRVGRHVRALARAVLRPPPGGRGRPAGRPGRPHRPRLARPDGVRAHERLLAGVRDRRAGAARRGRRPRLAGGLRRNEPVRFENNVQILDAVNAGQIALGLSNHYYWYERVAEVGEAAVPARVHYVPGADPLGLVNVAGAGGGSRAPRTRAGAAGRRVPGLRHRAAVLRRRHGRVPGARGHHLHRCTTCRPLSDLQPPDIDLSDLESLQQTLALLQETGLA